MREDDLFDAIDGLMHICHHVGHDNCGSAERFRELWETFDTEEQREIAFEVVTAVHDHMCEQVR